MLCRVEMPANEHIFGRFYRYRTTHTATGSAKPGIWLFPLLGIVLILLLFLNGVNLLFCGIAALLLCGIVYYTYWMKPASIFHKQPGAALQTEVTVFTPTGFNRSVRSEEGGSPDNTSASYSSLVKAVETKQDFYLFTGQTQAYLIDKNYITDGTAEELRAVLLKEMGAKFVFQA